MRKLLFLFMVVQMFLAAGHANAQVGKLLKSFPRKGAMCGAVAARSIRNAQSNVSRIQSQNEYEDGTAERTAATGHAATTGQVSEPDTGLSLIHGGLIVIALIVSGFIIFIIVDNYEKPKSYEMALPVIQKTECGHVWYVTPAGDIRRSL